MNVQFPIRGLSLVSALLLLPAAQGTSSDRLGGYDFGYEISGDARAKPVQVFDDGRSTYFQFRSGEPIPAIFTAAASGATLQVPQLEGPYVKVAAIAPEYALKLGYGTGRVAYLGANRARPTATATTAPVAANARPATPPADRLLAASQLVSGMPREMFQAPAPRIALEESSYATPIKGDAVEWSSTTERSKDYPVLFTKDSAKLTPAATKSIRMLVASVRAGARYEVIGRDDENHLERVAEGRAAAVVSALVSAGVARGSITFKTTAEVLESGKGVWQGATVRVWDAALPAPATRSEEEIASVISRLRAGRITASEAVALVEQAKRGTASTASTAATAPAPAAPAPAQITTWAVRKSDDTIEQMLVRWGKEAGWRVVWQGGPKVPITGDSSLTRPDFLQAADYVVGQAKTAGYKLRATAYSNQTLVITGDSN